MHAVAHYFVVRFRISQLYTVYRYLSTFTTVKDYQLQSICHSTPSSYLIMNIILFWIINLIFLRFGWCRFNGLKEGIERFLYVPFINEYYRSWQSKTTILQKKFSSKYTWGERRNNNSEIWESVHKRSESYSRQDIWRKYGNGKNENRYGTNNISFERWEKCWWNFAGIHLQNDDNDALFAVIPEVPPFCLKLICDKP